MWQYHKCIALLGCSVGSENALGSNIQSVVADEKISKRIHDIISCPFMAWSRSSFPS